MVGADSPKITDIRCIKVKMFVSIWKIFVSKSS